MRDVDAEVRAETARSMLDVRYIVTETFEAECAYPPCPNRFVSHETTSPKRRLYCSRKCSTAMCRLRQKQQGIRRTS